DEVGVDVDGGPTVGVVVAAAELVDALVVGPGGFRQHRVERVFLVVPVGGPDVVGEGVAGGELGGEVGDPGAAGGVDARLEAELVQLRGPRFEEGEDGFRRAR